MIGENNIKQNLLNNVDPKVNHNYNNVNNHQTIQLYCYSSNNNKIDNLFKLLIKQLKSRTFIVGYVTFINSSCNGLLFPILWLLCQHLGGNRLDQGLLVASISFGRFLFSTPMGMLTDIYRHQFVLLLSSIILILGSLLWIFASISQHISVLYIAQFLLGAGSATIGI
jgi:predicted MFS family arabinose efflux permease